MGGSLWAGGFGRSPHCAPPSFRNIRRSAPTFFSSISYSCISDDAAASTASDLGLPVKKECCAKRGQDRHTQRFFGPMRSFTRCKSCFRGNAQPECGTFKYPLPSSVLALALLLRRAKMLGSRVVGACLSQEAAVSSDVDLAATRRPCLRAMKQLQATWAGADCTPKVHSRLPAWSGAMMSIRSLGCCVAPGGEGAGPGPGDSSARQAGSQGAASQKNR